MIGQSRIPFRYETVEFMVIYAHNRVILQLNRWFVFNHETRIPSPAVHIEIIRAYRWHSPFNHLPTPHISIPSATK